MLSMFGRLNASNFNGSIQVYDNEFEKVLSKITDCYHLMKADKVALENDENKIRDVLLLNYLKNDKIRREVDLSQWHFEREVQEDHSTGRTDIKVISPNIFEQQEAYYILECKRLNNVNTTGISGLNAEYIENGIKRFITQYYSSFYRVNGMIGFIVEDLNIDENVKKINQLLCNHFSNTIQTESIISKENFIDNFKYHYSSVHKSKNDSNLKIYHLMLDFHKNIELN